MTFRKRLLLAITTGIIYFSPCLAGAVSTKMRSFYFFSGFYVFLGIFIVGYISAKNNFSSKTINLFVAVMSCCFIVTLFDLISRPLLRKKLYYRTYEMFTRRWPPMPSLTRYYKNVSYEGEEYGDLAAMSGVRDYRQTRKVIFKTDSFGFRNAQTASEKVLDIIILGDSFGVGNGTSQDEIMSSVFIEKYGLKAYNLSSVGSPWAELMNLKIEFKRLKTSGKTVLLWTIFTGNDLFEAYGGGMNPAVFNNPVKRFLVSFYTFRRRSPVRLLLKRFAERGETDKMTDMVIARDFLDSRKILFYKPYSEQRNFTADDILRHENYEKLAAVFGEMKKYSESKHINIAVVLIPAKSEVYSWALDGKPPWTSDSKPSAFSVVVKDISRRNGFRFLDLKPFLIDESKQVFDESGELLWWYDDTHWNGKGHSAAAAVIYENILSRIK